MSLDKVFTRYDPEKDVFDGLCKHNAWCVVRVCSFECGRGVTRCDGRWLVSIRTAWKNGEAMYGAGTKDVNDDVNRSGDGLRSCWRILLVFIHIEVRYYGNEGYRGLNPSNGWRQRWRIQARKSGARMLHTYVVSERGGGGNMWVAVQLCRAVIPHSRSFGVDKYKGRRRARGISYLSRPFG